MIPPFERGFIEARTKLWVYVPPMLMALDITTKLEFEFGRLLAYTRPIGADIPTPPGQRRLPPAAATFALPASEGDAAAVDLGRDAGGDVESSSP